MVAYLTIQHPTIPFSRPTWHFKALYGLIAFICPSMVSYIPLWALYGLIWPLWSPYGALPQNLKIVKVLPGFFESMIAYLINEKKRNNITIRGHC